MHTSQQMVEYHGHILVIGEAQVEAYSTCMQTIMPCDQLKTMKLFSLMMEVSFIQLMVVQIFINEMKVIM